MSLTVTQDNAAELRRALSRLAKTQVLVGVPQTEAERQSGDPITNAALAYIHDKGSAAQGIPARPFMEPGITKAHEAIEAQLGAAATSAVQGDPAGVTRRLNAAGLAAQAGIRGYINAGIAPALSEWTLMQRAKRGRRGARQELNSRDAGFAPSVDLAKPLLDTGQLRNSITYVLRVK